MNPWPLRIAAIVTEVVVGAFGGWAIFHWSRNPALANWGALILAAFVAGVVAQLMASERLTFRFFLPIAAVYVVLNTLVPMLYFGGDWTWLAIGVIVLLYTPIAAFLLVFGATVVSAFK